MSLGMSIILLHACNFSLFFDNFLVIVNVFLQLPHVLAVGFLHEHFATDVSLKDCEVQSTLNEERF